MSWSYIPLLYLPEGGPEDNEEPVTKEDYDRIKDTLNHYDYYEKKIFTSTVLYDLCKAIASDLNRLEYEHNEESREELVHIIYNTSCGEYKRSVNVTADSLAALARDVLKYIN